MLEPGEVADIVFRVRNAIGAANAKDVAITFVSPDTLIHIVSPPVQTADQSPALVETAAVAPAEVSVLGWPRETEGRVLFLAGLRSRYMLSSR